MAIEVKQQVYALYRESKDLLEEANKLFRDIKETRKEIERLKKRRYKNGRKNKKWY